MSANFSQLDRTRFMRLTSDPNTLPAKVQIMNGCIMFRRSGEEIAKQIAAGRYSQYVKSGGSR